jgi:xylulokinase
MILSIDCGSTNLKAALYDKNLRPVAQHSVPLVYDRRDAVHAEFDADRLWEAFQGLVTALLEKAGAPLKTVTHVAMGSQAQTFCLLDGRDRPLTPFISWMDVRAGVEAGELETAFGAAFHRHCSFAPPSPALQLSKMLWVRRHQPSVWAAARRLVSMPGFLYLKLSGLNILDTNLAAMSGLYSQATGTWWQDALDLAGIPPAWLPGLKPAGGAWRASISLAGQTAEPVMLVPCGNDHTAGAVGNGCRPGEVIVTFGTALVAYSRAGNEPGPYHPGGCWGPYPLGGFYELAASSHGCSALDWAREVLLPGRPASEFDALALTATPGSGGVRFHPARARTDSAWVGDGSQAERARAVLEGILFTLRRMLERDVRAPRDRQVCALGGGSKSAIWMQLAADILGCTVRRGAGDSLLGAAALAAGSAETLESGLDRGFAPDPASVALYDDLIGRNAGA